ncbi:hypothetical protein [Nocardiopsis synnemataformans]
MGRASRRTTTLIAQLDHLYSEAERVLMQPSVRKLKNDAFASFALAS